MPKGKRDKPASARSRKVHRPKVRKEKPEDDSLDRLKGKIQIVGDIVSPVESPDAWQYDLNNLNSKPRP
jgi:hypothetical protein